MNPKHYSKLPPYEFISNVSINYEIISNFSTVNQSVRVLSLRSSVIHGFVTEPWHSRYVLFSYECAASSVFEPCALSSACLVSCWSVVFESWHSCLEFRFRAGGSDTRAPCSCCVGVQSQVCSATHSSVHVYCVLCSTRFVFSHVHIQSHAKTSCVFARSLCIYRLHAFMLCFVFFIGCVLSCCRVLYEHMAYEYSHLLLICSAGHVLVFLFCLSTWLLS